MLRALMVADPDVTPFWVRRRQLKRWPMARSVDYGLQLARALEYCHDAAFSGYRVMHRDVKPNNIGLGEDDRLVLFDFGLACLWPVTGKETDAHPRPLTGETGSLRYMSPEVCGHNTQGTRVARDGAGSHVAITPARHRPLSPYK